MQTKPHHDHDNTPHAANSIVVGVDGTRSALTAVRWAAAEARVRGVELRIVHAAPYAADPKSPQSRRVRSILGVAYSAVRRAAPDVVVSTGSSSAQPAAALVAAAETAQLLVVGSLAASSYEILPSSVALDVAGHASCPVAVVRGRTQAGPEPVLAGIDDPLVDAAVLDVAFAEAALHRCGLVVLHAHAGLREHLPGHTAHEEQRRVELTAALREWSARYPQVHLTRRTPAQSPTTALLAAAHGARLLVVGHNRRGAGARVLFDSHSRAMVRHSPVPVLVVDPDVRSSTRSPATPALHS